MGTDWPYAVDEEADERIRCQEQVLSPDITAPRNDGLPDRCVSAITIGQNVYWCERGKRDHEGLCGGSDPWGGNAEWRFWLDAR